MIVIAEPTCIDSEHAQFNAAVVEIAVILASGSEIVFYGHPSHIEAVKQVFGGGIPNNVSWHPIAPPPRRLRHFVRRFLIEFLLFRKILKASRKCDLLIVTSAMETSLPALKTQCFLSGFGPRINIIFHAGLQQFLYSWKRHKLLSVAIPKNMAYIVLGKYIELGIIKRIPELTNKLFAVEHPYLFNTTTTKSNQPNSPPIFGFVGLANKAKGFDLFLKIIECQNKINTSSSPKLFKLVGKVADDCVDIFEKFTKSESVNLLCYPTKREKLPLTDYQNEVNSVDYFVMPYDKIFYEFICSGAAMDAIYFRKPIIALKSSYFTYLFDLCGDIGYLCENIIEMESTITNLIKSNDHTRYENQRANLVYARTFFSPMTIATDMKKINIKTASRNSA